MGNSFSLDYSPTILIMADNLTKWAQNCTPEQMKEITSKAGKASGAARRKKRELRNYLEAALELTDSEGIDNYTKLTLALLEKAQAGDVSAYNTIRDTLGQTIKQQLEIDTKDKIVVNITDNGNNAQHR